MSPLDSSSGDSSQGDSATMDASLDALGDAISSQDGGVDSPADAPADTIVPPRDTGTDSPLDAPPDAPTTFAVCGGSVKGCDPVTNAGCAAGSHCVWQNIGIYTCTANNGNKTWNAQCGDFTECAATYDCFPIPPNGNPQYCEKYCCNNGDCPASTTCHTWDVAGLCY
jgi:hypothetical protein